MKVHIIMVTEVQDAQEVESDRLVPEYESHLVLPSLIYSVPVFWHDLVDVPY